MDSRLSIGEELLLKRGLLGRLRVVYAGMPNADTFSLVIHQTDGYAGYGYNLYFPRDTQSVKLRYGTLEVLSVSPELLRVGVRR